MPGDDARTARRVRRAALCAAVATGALVAAALPVTFPAGASLADARAAAPEGAPARYATVELDQAGVGIAPDGSVVEIPVGEPATFLPGTRVLDPRAGNFAAVLDGRETAPGLAAARALAAEQRAWLGSGTVPGGDGPYADLARTALLDLRTLVLPGGAAVAGWSPYWRYVWPRDAAFAAVALARTGHVDDAVAVLGFLARAQESDGGFEARYLPDGSGPPDDRARQTDGRGWAMWAAGEVLAELPAADAGTRLLRRTVALELAPLVARALDGTVALLGSDGLPPASPDYWERSEHRLTLGTAAPLVAGLEQAADVLAAAGDDERAATARQAADAARTATVAAFAPGGFARYAEGGSRDAATAFVLAPFWGTPAPGAHDAWLASAVEMRRPLGLAPAGEWRDDGITWTPQTSLYAWVAAENGDDEAARAWLDTIATHRTSVGAIPEKVLADGSPAAVAPLSWSSANVLLALDALER
ncbi:glycoside hydrolase family 15 [Cellulomonas sp. DKR-3]|uniref:Glycoside hydrolase family 15 n=1 Tax=Cellulomonas fulva TaxID=2835530 RepID=A0ABS5TVF5_9CELL|nr:glycoside hydrolase family 15 [Cellulomonas fulva]MBT0993134.1 glycoside hydrolase family 15 [Cellulomonas fulva]